jgi:rhombotail lipoprotein
MKNTLSLVIIVTLLFITGCASKQTSINSSVVDYLYSNDTLVQFNDRVPKLEIPLKIGIAFVPVTAGSNSMDLTENNKANLLESVAKNFRQYNIVKNIEVIPSAYLKSAGGFKNLDQISHIYDIDIVALISYDQVQFTDEGALSLSYLTIIGAYIFSGEKNDTSTMLDTTIYDIKSRKLLFRAPGTSNVKGSSTPINLSEELRLDSIESFKLATKDMINNLDHKLAVFRQKLKDDPTKAKVVYED